MSVRNQLDIGLFHPQKISGNILWLSASRITGVTNGGAVPQWNDISGSSNHASQATTSKQPTLITNAVNGSAAVSVGATQSLNINGIAPVFNGSDKPFTISVLLQHVAITGYGSWLSINNNLGDVTKKGSYVFQNNVQGYRFSFLDDVGLNIAAGNHALDTNWHVLTFRCDGHLLDAWLDGQIIRDGHNLDNPMYALTYPAVTPFGNTTTNIASLIAAGGTINFAELAVFNRALTGVEVNQLHRYMGSRGGIDVRAVYKPGTTGRFSRPGPVEVFPPMTATKLSDSLGFNLSPITQPVVQLAKDAGASEIRFQPAWSNTENMAGVLSLQANAASALDWCASIGVEPMLVAGYGPPAQLIQTVTLASDVAAGSYYIPVNEDISAVNPPYCHVYNKSTNGQITDRWSYSGSLIDSVNTASKTLVLACRTNAALTAGTQLGINRLKYSSINSTDPNDPSVVAYCRYVRYLADQITARGLTGTVEIWNEPIWAHDPWDLRPAFYDYPTGLAATISATGGNLAAGQYVYSLSVVTPTGTSAATTAGYYNVSGTTSKATVTWPSVPVATGYILYRTNRTTGAVSSNSFSAGTTSIVDNGTTYSWTNGQAPFSSATMSPKSEAVLQNLMATPRTDNVRYVHAGPNKSGNASMAYMSFNPTQAQLDPSFSDESYHPYADRTASHAWYPEDFSPLRGTNISSNMRNALAVIETKRNVIGPNYGWRVTEMGTSDNNDTSQAQYNMCDFLLYSAIGAKRINFYALNGGNYYNMINLTTSAPRLAYTAFKNLMTKINLIKGVPSATLSARLPRIQSFTGALPLTVIPIMGSGNTLLWAMWQREFDPATYWNSSPAAVSVILEISPGSTVVSAWNAITNAAVTVTTNGNFISCAVQEQPIILQLTIA